MSIHRSLVIIGKLRRHRNVLKKSERLERLLADGKPADEISVFELPKLRNIMAKAKPKPKKEDAAAEGAVPAEGAVAAPSAAGKTALAPKGATAAAGKAAPGAKASAAAAGKAAPGAAGKPAAKADAPKAGKK